MRLQTAWVLTVVLALAGAALARADDGAPLQIQKISDLRAPCKAPAQTGASVEEVLEGLKKIKQRLEERLAHLKKCKAAYAQCERKIGGVDVDNPRLATLLTARALIDNNTRNVSSWGYHQEMTEFMALDSLQGFQAAVVAANGKARDPVAKTKLQSVRGLLDRVIGKLDRYPHITIGDFLDVSDSAESSVQDALFAERDAVIAEAEACEAERQACDDFDAASGR